MNRTSRLDETLRDARALWNAGRHAEAEQLLSPAAAAAAAGDAEVEARLRVALATTFKYLNASTRAYAEVERVMALPAISADIAKRARRLAISVSYEERRFDRVEQLAGDDVGDLVFVAISYLKDGRHADACALGERLIAMVERNGDRVTALRWRCEVAVWRVAPKFGAANAPAGRAAVVAAALDELALCEMELATIDTDAARAVRCKLDWHRAVVFEAAGRTAEAWAAVQRSVAHADKSDSPVDRGNARKLAVTLLLGRARRGDQTVLDDARLLVDEMVRFLLEGEIAGGLVEAARLAAGVDHARASILGERDAWRSAVAWLEQGDRWLADARRETREPGAESTDTTQRALVGGSADLYTLAIEILLKQLCDTTAAFEWTERLKGRAMSEMIGMGPLPPPSGVSPELIADETRARAALAAACTHDEVWQAHKELEHAWEQLASDPAAGAYVTLRRGAALSFRELRTLLAAEDSRLQSYRAGARVVMIELVVLGDQLVVFGVRSDRMEPLVHEIAGSYATLADAIAVALRNPRRGLRALLEHPQLRHCLEPIVNWTSPGDVICIAAAGLLYAVPLHAVRIGGTTLMERNGIVYVPSATAFRTCLYRRLPEGAADAAAVFSNPTNDLPGATREAVTVAAVLGVHPLNGADATRAQFLGAIPRSTIVHVASHAKFDSSDPLQSAIVFADGEVTARELLVSPGGRLRLVTLSACESGVHAVHTGDELLGLTRALLAAGAASVLVTLWKVADEPTRALMHAFYDRWRNRSEPKVFALANAQQDAIAAGHVDPAAWAPFTLVGDWW